MVSLSSREETSDGVGTQKRAGAALRLPDASCDCESTRKASSHICHLGVPHVPQGNLLYQRVFGFDPRCTECQEK